MIHYHGTPIGGKVKDIPDFMSGRHVLVPWTYPEQLGLAIECSKSFVLDNGAFTIWKSGGSRKWCDYYSWVMDVYRCPNFDWALIPDVIDGTEEKNDELLLEWPDDLRHVGVPVFHVHESLERLARLVSQYHRIALGSSGEFSRPGKPMWKRRMADLMNVICDERGLPKCKIHGLRMMDSRIVSRYPLSSADSTNAAQNGSRKAKQMRVSTVVAQIAIARRTEEVMSASTWEPEAVEQEYLPV